MIGIIGDILGIIKDLFGSIYGCFYIGAVFLGGLYCFVAYRWFGILYIAPFIIVPWAILYRRERSKEACMAKLDVQISTERQSKALDEYLNLASVKKVREDRAKES
jgi:hypothetical protein